MKYTDTMVRTLITNSSSSIVREINTRYEEAVKTLNTLQTNAQTIERMRQERDRNAHLNIPNMISFAERAGIQMQDVDRLKVIHVSGTKGKGSTCAFCESILKQYGYRTGFYSSPHLVEVRERFRVNGSAIDREMFSQYFWDVYNRLNQTKASHDGKMPNYFGFLTVMALHVFLQEKVDVAILEVGIGGEYDCTNMIKSPVVCGVSSLGLDHTSILGTTIDQIAWHKAGIFKTGAPAITAHQPPEAMKVLQHRASAVNVPLSVCPDISQYTPHGSHQVQLGIKGAMQRVNASLALQLCNVWLLKVKEKADSQTDSRETNIDTEYKGCNSRESGTCLPAPGFVLSPEMMQGLKQCQWLGRNQTIKSQGITYYLDGAHTAESIQQCADWFREASSLEAAEVNKPVWRVMIFNTTGDRDTAVLLSPFLECQLDDVLFCPNLAYLTAMSADQTNNTVTKESQFKRCLSNKQVWEQLKQQNMVSKPEKKVSLSAANGHQPYSPGQQKGDNGSPCPSIMSTSQTCIDASTSSTGLRDENQTNQPPSKRASAIETSDSDKNACNNHSALDDIPNSMKHFPDCLSTQTSHAFPSIAHCVAWATQGQGASVDDKFEMPPFPFADMSKHHVQILVTGSLHLVGGTLSVLQEDT